MQLEGELAAADAASPGKRARCRRSPHKTQMTARFPRRTLDSDGTAGCHTQGRTFYFVVLSVPH